MKHSCHKVFVFVCSDFFLYIVPEVLCYIQIINLRHAVMSLLKAVIKETSTGVDFVQEHTFIYRCWHLHRPHLFNWTRGSHISFCLFLQPEL